ncbi:MAG TPA: hypothetical protein VF753_02115 [Terriglobales bacterium]
MKKTIKMITLALLALAAGLGTAGRLQAEDAKPGSSTTMGSIDPYLMDRDAEVAMARSAAPASIAKDATVLVLGRRGYETAVEGKNGFVCAVGRSWDLPKNNAAFWDPKIHGPICLSAPGARSFLPIYLKKTELAIAGRSNVQIEDAITVAIATGELPTPESGSVSYMLSKQGYLNEGIKGPWLPHVMLFVSQIDPKALGSDAGDDVPLDAHEEKIGRYTTIDIPVSKWSDGTPAPTM